MQDGALSYWGLEATTELTILFAPPSSLQASSPSSVLQEAGFYALYPPGPLSSHVHLGLANERSEDRRRVRLGASAHTPSGFSVSLLYWPGVGS